MREYVVRLMYCEMLGHEVSWAYIHAINMTQVMQAMAFRFRLNRGILTFALSLSQSAIQTARQVGGIHRCGSVLASRP